VTAGDTFILSARNIDPHLWIVLSNPDFDDSAIVIINLTTSDGEQESHCILNAGDHPFVRHPTVPSYRDAKIVSLAKLHELSKCGLLNYQQRMPAEHLNRVYSGALESDFLPEGCRKILEEQIPPL
jgi:hypothetical protein